ncbi:MAG TPA: HAMP domain-containing sensor histidine kinase [Acidimicrobiia bacterium]|nr:HAMP domain-containing sensor histidine kinase [Acidimicrobiia bacterium]
MRRQIVSMTVAVTSIVVIAFVLPLMFLVRTIAADRATNKANADAQYVGQIIAGNRTAAPGLVAQADATSSSRISVYYPDGSIVGDRSRPPAAESLQLAGRGRSFSRSTSGGVDVFLPVLQAGGKTAVVRVSVPGSDLRRGVMTAWLSLAGLGVALVLLAGLVADRMARSITKPLNTLTQIARRLADGELDARSRVRGSVEVVEVSRALDMLAVRIGDLLRAEREYAADLSHSLRTPLTALRLDAELLGDTAEAGRIMTAVDDLEAAVTMVIADTRRDRRVADERGGELSEVVRERMAFWEVLARAQRRPLEVCLHPDALPVDARRDDLQQLVDVLVDNVLRHTPAGGAARVTTAPGSNGGARLVVEDSGAGFAGPEPKSAKGTGLGLEIARRVARDAAGSVTLGRSDLGGARVEIEFGPPVPSA